MRVDIEAPGCKLEAKSFSFLWGELCEHELDDLGGPVEFLVKVGA